MCGISGILDPEQKISRDNKLEYGKNLNSLLRHRGPDGQGLWMSDNSSVLLCHTRLSILDISNAGHQPMKSMSGKYIISYNGEIYNFIELRSELKSFGVSFKSDSDTEVLVNAFDYWGIDNTLEKLTGMFAIALYNKIDNVFYLIRDRFGIKPLYYSITNGCLFFGSELKAITSFEGARFNLNYDALSLYFRYGYINSPLSIFENVFKLEPATYIKIENKRNRLESTKFTYWGIENAMLSSLYKGSFTECADDLESLLQKSVDLRMRTDVPFGAFLSGGYDSSLIVALMQKNSSQPINTYSIGFENEIYNEAVYAKAVADRLSTCHTELYVNDQDVIETIPKLSAMFDEPFADSSQIPTYLVSQLAKNDVTVVLSGDGADENFGGYNRYFRGKQLNNLFKMIPPFTRKILSQCFKSANPSVLDSVDKFLPKKFKLGAKSDQFKKLGLALNATDLESIYNQVASIWHISPILRKELLYHENIYNQEIADISPLSACMLVDIKSYLPADILCKVDRTSMAVSLETRVPFLDHKVAQFAANIPMKYKVNGRQGKVILKELLKRNNIWDLVDRPKSGFCIPIGDYFKNELKDWLINKLDYKKIKNDGILDYKLVSNVCESHFQNVSNNQHMLWSLVSFQTFVDNNKKIIF